jgi:hypothetical protein
MNKETVEQAALEKYPVKIDDTLSIDSGLLGRKAFIAGAEWQKEQSATDAIEFVEWVMQWPYRYLLGKSYKELYELWKKKQ